MWEDQSLHSSHRQLRQELDSKICILCSTHRFFFPLRLMVKLRFQSKTFTPSRTFIHRQVRFATTWDCIGTLPKNVQVLEKIQDGGRITRVLVDG